jgi:ribosome recycling factor
MLWGSVAHLGVEKYKALVLRRVCIEAWPAAQRVWALAAIAYAKMRTMIRAWGKNRLKNIRMWDG